MTSSHVSPCVKMLSPRRYSLMVFANPDDSRNTCALNAGTAFPAARAVFRGFTQPSMAQRRRDPMYRIAQVQTIQMTGISLHGMAELVVRQRLPYNPVEGHH